jgi:proteasome lid subunit RPN8/RPN11
MREAAVVVSVDGEPLFWHRPESRTVVSLPDSKTLWDVLWDHRDRLAGVAHTHPGSGVPSPSHTDVTTFAAIESGLGRKLFWWILSADVVIVCWWVGPERLAYAKGTVDEVPTWAEELRRLSNEEVVP